METMTMRRTDERGVALVMALFLTAALSALAVSLMFLSQTETSSTRNYRTMSQARYAGEAGVHKAINYLLNSYAAPSSFGNYNLTVSPVTCSSGCPVNGPVVLSAMTGVSSNYPDSTVASGFAAAVQGTLATNVQGTLTNLARGTVTYGAYATLMSMRQVAVYGGSTRVIQTWKIVSDGTVPGTTPATVEVTSTLEQNVTDATTYAVFATGASCGAITMSGNASTDSYDSSSMTLSSGAPVTQTSGGAVGTNGNLTVTGSVDVHGTLSSPRTGVGSCTAGSVDALSATGPATVQDGLIQLPQAVTFPTPAAPSPTPPTTTLSYSSSTSCTTLWSSLTPANPTLLLSQVTGTAGNCTITTNGLTLLLGNVGITGGVLTLAGGSSSTANVNINGMTLSGNASVGIATGTSVVMNVAGTGQSTPLDFTGGGDLNTSFDPSRLQILYAGTGELKVTGGNKVAATFYAPNAVVSTHGNGAVYGSILSASFTDAGNTNFNYDRNLQRKFVTLGNFVMTSFSWKKY
jgi:Tfp pilus assembly protein PilX